MSINRAKSKFTLVAGLAVVSLILVVVLGQQYVGYAAPSNDAPVPLLKAGHAVDWWFVFKFNSKAFPGCGGEATRTCSFGGDVQNYKAFGQQFVYASSENAALQKGSGCTGDTTSDPLGATFDEVYNNSFYYVVWNDQFYDDPAIKGCTKECGAPWGHSKGMLAWNEAGVKDLCCRLPRPLGRHQVAKSLRAKQTATHWVA